MTKSKFSNYLKTYFTFSKGERNGILVLLIILLIVIVSIFLVPKAQPNKNQIDFANLKQQVDSLFVNDSTRVVKAGFPRRDKTFRPQKASLKVELNSSDSSELTKLSGIGPVFASRIIKYRKLLGGYYHINQLAEVYGLKEETITSLKEQITINARLINGIMIDTAGFRTLVRHPYIGKERTSKIISLRKKISPLQEKDLISAQIFDSIQWQKVKPYIVFQTSFN